MNPVRDPVADLRRVAFLLERSLESTYRVKAFRTAAAALAALPPDDVALLASTGSLRSIKGIGERTASVVEQSVAGQEPDYLIELTERTSGRLANGGDELRAALRGDLHSHSDWSDGGSPIAEMAATAADLGHAYTALTDHSPRLTVANGLTPQRLLRQLDVVAEVNEAFDDFHLLTGIEVDILTDGGLDQSEELLGRLDVVVASVHSELRMPSEAMTRRMIAAIRNPHTDVLGHCTGRYVIDRQYGSSSLSGRTRGGKARPPSSFDAAAVFAACAQAGVAVEINSRPERLDPPLALLRRAVAEGCLFAIDTDAHAPGQLDWQLIGCDRAMACGVPASSIVNTWPVEDLLAWADDHTHRPA
ncbi:MAG: PHP domain-containing protein [Kineosporiaceae bacterium]|nr:PHP domain-containing protein [Kineosporiaceae bacterium]MBK8077340.1 PHP domain-containing protein [Kineosporiaceae bacterium]